MSSASSVAGDDASESDYGSDITIPVTEEQQPCFFWKLPPEIRLIVYELVYGEKETVQILGRRIWEAGERTRRKNEGSAYQPRDFPECSVSHLMVCKQFFDETVSVYMEAKIFKLSFYDADAFTKPKSPVHRYISHMAKSVSTDSVSSCMPELLQLPRLSRMFMSIGTACFDDISDTKLPWRDSFTDLEIARTWSMQGMSTLCSLSEVRVVSNPRDCELATHQGEAKVIWEGFIKQVAALVRDVVKRPRDPKTVTELIPSIEDALRMRAASGSGSPARSSVTMSEIDGAFEPLKDHEVPQTEAACARLFLTRGQAMFGWMKQAATRIRDLEAATQSTPNYAVQPTDESSHANFLNALSASETANADSEDDS